MSLVKEAEKRFNQSAADLVKAAILESNIFDSRAVQVLSWFIDQTEGLTKDLILDMEYFDERLVFALLDGVKRLNYNSPYTTLNLTNFAKTHGIKCHLGPTNLISGRHPKTEIWFTREYTRGRPQETPILQANAAEIFGNAEAAPEPTVGTLSPCIES